MTDTWTWATVTQASPLRIKVDGDTAALDATTGDLVGSLAVDDRVRVHLHADGIIVAGLQGGIQDNGGLLLTLSADVVEYSAGTSPRAYKAGRVVTIAGAVKPANSTAAANFDTGSVRICDVPSNMQPPNGYSAHSIQQGSGKDRWLLYYGSGGLYGTRYGPGTPSTTTWFPFSITYVTGAS